MTLTQWSIKWGIPYNAIAELNAVMGVDLTPPAAPATDISEGGVSSRVRLEISKKCGGILWRNNVGVAPPAAKGGRPVRYGLANDSKQKCEKFKSSDLIGLRPVQIQPQHVGHIFGLFVARETKHGRWTFSGTAREEAQFNFIKVVKRLGGDASFANSEGTF